MGINGQIHHYTHKLKPSRLTFFNEYQTLDICYELKRRPMKIDVYFLIGLSVIYDNMGGVILTKIICSFLKELTHVPCKINKNETEVFCFKPIVLAQGGEHGENGTCSFPNEAAVVSPAQVAKDHRFKKFSSKSKQDKFEHRNKPGPRSFKFLLSSLCIGNHVI